MLGAEHGHGHTLGAPRLKPLRPRAPRVRCVPGRGRAAAGRRCGRRKRPRASRGPPRDPRVAPPAHSSVPACAPACAPARRPSSSLVSHHAALFARLCSPTSINNSLKLSFPPFSTVSARLAHLPVGVPAAWETAPARRGTCMHVSRLVGRGVSRDAE